MPARKIHNVKCWPRYFDAVKRGDKTFEIRKNDRDYQHSDKIILNRYDPELHDYTGEQMEFIIGFIFEGGMFGLEPDYVCFSLLPVRTE